MGGSRLQCMSIRTLLKHLFEHCSQIKPTARWQAPCRSMAMWLIGLALIGGCDERNSTGADSRRVASAPAFARWVSPSLDSLEALSIETLRQRTYAADIRIQQSIAPTSTSGYRQRYLGSYLSDGLAVYLRIDVPSTQPPSGGYPSVVFVHGWIGERAAPDYDFELDAASASAAVIEAYVDAGFVVMTPGLRGHGTVSGSAADGLEFLRAWDNRSYLSPIFYAIDVLNLIAGLESLERVDWPAWGREARLAVRLDQARINLAGYSQGGDVALTVLAITGATSALALPIQAASIWAGCFASRLEQAAFYGPMQDTAMAFTAGDGRWNGSATAADGRRNADFVFAYPSDLIVDPSPADWTWQTDSWHLPTVEASLNKTYSDMYARYRTGIADLADINFRLERDDQGSLEVVHAAGLARQLERIGGYHAAHYLTEPINLHHSDRDFYSPPAWNANLATRVNAAGGRVRDFIYPGTTHSLSVSSEAWFSPAGTVEGRETMIARDIALFSGQEVR